MKRSSNVTLLRNGHVYPGDSIRGYEALLMFESRCLTMAESLLVLLLCWDMGVCHGQRISLALFSSC